VLILEISAEEPSVKQPSADQTMQSINNEIPPTAEEKFGKQADILCAEILKDILLQELDSMSFSRTAPPPPEESPPNLQH
jgi:hypothetical protein